MDIVHLPVMVEEVVRDLAPVPDRSALLVDCTLGEGGHSARFLADFPELRVVGVDADATIQAKARQRLAPFGDRMRFFNAWYDGFWADCPLGEPADRILFDLGISVFHYVESGRGFSFAKDEPLDMRLAGNAGPGVADWLADCTEAELADVLFEFGEERYGRRIARAVLAERERSGRGVFADMGAAGLAKLIWDAVPADYRHGRIHPATRSFQALRIRVNNELERIQRALEGAYAHLAPGGRLGVISFHSLEDRLVKNFFREMSRECICPPEQPRCTCGGVARARLVHRKVVLPTDAETAVNPPSRSARWRVLEKVRD
jgi:16S rRNA (cytosine1402-N4)-methyltransferase